MKLLGFFSALALSLALQPADASTTIEGYLQPCSLILGSDVSTVKFEIFATSEEAVQSLHQVMRPLHTAFLDGGAGGIIMKIDKDSQTRRMCVLAKADGGKTKVTLEVNDKQVIEKFTMGSETIVSDSTFLLDSRTQIQFDKMAQALIQTQNRLYALIEQTQARDPINMPPADPPQAPKPLKQPLKILEE